MTSIAAPVQFAQTAEIFESTVYDSIDDDSQDIDNDTEMADAGAHEYQEAADFDDQEMYNAEVGSTIVEPPQSDILLTHATSTILDEMEYLEEVDYEEQDPASKEPDIHLVPETASYKPDTTQAHTPPATSYPESQPHSHFFSPAARIVPLPRPATPLLSTLTTTADDDVQDDDWPICLHTPVGQEYMLFRSDGDTEALFEDNWLKSQPLETLFSSIRQTLETELASLTTSFAMDEIVLAVPDLDVAIAEDNCYTREISLQDLVNLINSLCTRNGTERAATCRLQLSLQPRFIARFNQLVSMTSQNVDIPEKTGDDSQDVEETQEAQVESHGDEEVPINETEQVDDFHVEDEQPLVEEPAEGEHEEVYEYEGDENAEEAEYEEEETAEAQIEGQSEDLLHNENSDAVAAGDDAATVQALEHEEDELAEAEEDELYEENEESYDPALQATESVVNEEDVGEEGLEEQEEQEEVDLVESFDENPDEDQDYEEDPEEYDDEAQDAEEADEQEQPDTTEVEHSHDASEQKDEDNEDDLISYEEAADQTEDGQDYRQQYLNEDQNGDPNGQVDGADNPTNGSTDETVAEDTSSGRNSPGSKRPLNQVTDPSVEDQAPPSKRAKS